MTIINATNAAAATAAVNPTTTQSTQPPKTQPYPEDTVEISGKPNKKEAARNIGTQLLALASVILPVLGEKYAKFLPILGIISQMDGPINEIINNLTAFVPQKSDATADAKSETKPEETQAAA